MWEKKGKETPCEQCPKVKNKPKVLPGNTLVEEAVSKFFGLLFDGYGGMNPNGIEFILNYYKLEGAYRELTADKIMHFCNSYAACRAEEMR